MPYERIDLSQVRTYSIARRQSKVALDHLITPATPVPPFEDPGLEQVGAHISAARRAGAPVIWMFGGHLVKRGLAPVVIDLMERGLITHLASNGAATIHDFEIALNGQTSEDVATSIETGSFGMAEETGGLINRAIRAGVSQGLGAGEALGKWIAGDEAGFPFRQHSLVYNAYRLGIPYTIHIAIGTDIIHQHPQVDFAALGWASGEDFKIFTAAIARLEGGVFCNFGSAVIGPEVFLKALSVARNLGHTVRVFTTANFDLFPMQDAHSPVGDDEPVYYYRPRKNIINRPTSLGGQGFHICGDHSQTVPNLAAALRREAERQPFPRPALRREFDGPLQAVERFSPRASRLLARALAAQPALNAISAPLARIFTTLLLRLRQSGTLFVWTPEGRAPGRPRTAGRTLPPAHASRLAGLPHAGPWAGSLRPELRLLALGRPEQGAPQAAYAAAQELYALARAGDALLCCLPQGESEDTLAAVQVALTLGLPAAVLGRGPLDKLRAQPGLLLLELEQFTPDLDPVYQLLVDLLAAALLDAD